MGLSRAWGRAGAWLLVLFASSASAQTSFQDALVQPPSLGAPQAGALVGSLSGVAFGSAELVRGAYRLPSNMSLPGARGDALAPIFPAYSPEHGISEWGMGWRNDLAIERFRLSGDLDYLTDDFTSPLGRLVKGEDDAWYPAGLRTTARFQFDASGWLREGPAGARYRYRASDAIQTPRGAYAWTLGEVTTVLGESATFEYERNASGRPFLRFVRYGGRGAEHPYEVELVYESLRNAFEDLHSGTRLELDRRVSAVLVKTRHATTGSLELSWRYDLAYESSPLGGPAFYLRRVTRTFASGFVEPSSEYVYDYGDQTLVETRLRLVPGLDPFLRSTGGGGLEPSRATFYDLEDDGLIDIEHHRRQGQARLRPEGWTFGPLEPSPEPAHRYCRPEHDTQNIPRVLARLRPASAEPEVFNIVEGAETGSGSRLIVCDRLGQPIHGQSVGRGWSLGPNTRLVDLNRDHRPDVVRVHGNGFDVLENTSTSTSYRFTEHLERGYLDLPRRPETAWIHDFNGDGIADIIARYGSSVSIALGKGNFEFDSSTRAMGFWNSLGVPISNLGRYEFSFVDSNRDGLTDVLLRLGRTVTLFINQGRAFRQFDVGAFEGIPWDFGFPVIGDFAGTGDVEVGFVHDERLASAALNAPSTGLLASATDGQGTSLRFEYGRAPAVPGNGTRAPVLGALHVTSSGQPEVSYAYDYSGAVHHSRSRVLVGFTAVERTGPLARERVEFHNDDDLAGIVLVSSTADTSSTTMLRKFAQTVPEEATYLGVRLLRPKVVQSGWSRLDGTAITARATEIVAYERGVCPTRSETRTPHGTLVTESVLARFAGIADAGHCLPSLQTWTGTHSDRTLDFVYAIEIARNAAGQPESITGLAPSGAIPHQSVTYDAEGRLASITTPNAGRSELYYAPRTGLLERIVAADGVVTRVAEYDPLTDAVRMLEVDRGRGGLFASHFRFDGAGRLERSWTDVGGSEAQPTKQLTYRFATPESPASIRVRSRIDDGIFGEHVRWMSASGEDIGEAARIPEGWDVGALLRRDPRAGRVSSLRRPVLPPTADLERLAHADLFTATASMATTRFDGLGQAVARETTLAAGVVQRSLEERTLRGGRLVVRSIENGRHVTRSVFDADGHVEWTEDESGARTTREHDALGRVVRVTFADGKKHSIHFDDHGRTAWVEREGVGRVVYAYDPRSGHLESRTFQTPDGRPERTTTYARDGAGRTTSETHALTGGDPPTVFTFDYDGNLAPEPLVRGQRGFLTRVRGPDFEKRIVHERDGAVREASYVLGNWRRYSVRRTHLAGGALATEAHRLEDTAGRLMASVAQTFRHDSHGRLEFLDVEGHELAHLFYDAKGRFDRVEFAGGEQVAARYDEVTEDLRGLWADGTQWQVGVEWTFDDRARIAAESMTFGGEPLVRAYGYDRRGFLTSARDPSGSTTYAYSASGLPTSVTDARGQRDVTRGASTIQSGDELFGFDALARVVSRGDRTFEYGPAGHIDRARVGGDTLRYVYDEAGQRVMKYRNGVPEEGRIDGIYFDEDRMILPVRLGGRVVGALIDGQFQLLATDPRGTIVSETGAPALASPYGDRSEHTSLAAALEYVEKGYDHDLGVVRMGVRDYDPHLGQFWSADTLFLESPEASAGSPVDGNLFAYARNNPVANLDPSGKFAPVAFGFALGGMALAFESDQQVDISAVVPGGAGVALNVMYAGHELRELSTKYQENDAAMRSVLAAFDAGELDFMGASALSRALEDDRASILRAGAIQVALVAVDVGSHVASTIGAPKAPADVDVDPFMEYMNAVEGLDVSTARNGAVFYSGKGQRELAEEFALANGRTTLEMTPGGKWLDEQKLWDEGPSPLTHAEAHDVWSRLSRRFAEEASGVAFGFVDGAMPGGVFNSVEFPSLRDGAKVQNVITGGL